MKERLRRLAKLAVYPAIYVFSLALFGYLTFPFGLLKDRAIAEFSRMGKPGQRLEIEKLSSYWFSGVELTNVKLILPPDESPGAAAFTYNSPPGDAGGVAAGPKETVISVDEAHVRVRLLPLLIGRVRVDFWASTMGGEIHGTLPVGNSGGDVKVEVEKVELGKIDPLVALIGVPIRGTATGTLALSTADGKLSKADGSLDLTVADIAIGDSKAGIHLVVGDPKMGINVTIDLPTAHVGTLTLAAEAKEGVLKVTKLASQGTDVELVGDGRITAKDPWNASQADLYLRFKLADAYRTKTDTTKSLLGDPASALPGLIEMQVPKMKKAKRADGFYGWHMHGSLKDPRFDPSTVDVAPPPGVAGAGGRAGKKEFKKPAGVNLPFGASTANNDSPPPVPTPVSPPAPPPGVMPPPQPNRAPPVDESIHLAPHEAPAIVDPTPQPAPPPPPPPPPQPVPEQVVAPEVQQAPPAEPPIEVPR